MFLLGTNTLQALALFSGLWGEGRMQKIGDLCLLFHMIATEDSKVMIIAIMESLRASEMTATAKLFRKLTRF